MDITLKVRHIERGSMRLPSYIVQTCKPGSGSGEGWKTQMIFTVEDYASDAAAKQDAEYWARIFVLGATYAGATVRATSGGYNL